MSKRVSVIIPTYNRYKMLKQTIESIYAQKNCEIEIIVIDDNSIDETNKIKDEFPCIHYFRNDINMGPGYNRKLGLQNATGEYVVFVDDDDYYINFEFYSKAINLMECRNDLIFVSGNAQVYNVQEERYEDKELNVYGEMDSIEYLRGFIIEYQKPLSTFTTMFRKSALEKADFDSMLMINDMAIYMRSLNGGSIYFIDDVVGVYRIHSTNISKNINKEFLIANLEEKFFVYNRIKKEKWFEEYVIWWNIQIKATIGYWIYESKPKIQHVRELKEWCFAHTDDGKFIIEIFDIYEKYLKDYKKYILKTKLKKFLGMHLV